MKKVLLVLTAALSFLFFSCGSTKQESEITQELEPLVEQAAEEAVAQAIEETTEETSEETDQAALETAIEETAQETEDINELYPPLEEIEDPELIEISPQEIEAQEAAKAALDEQAEIEKNKITEPVVETEELPPLPEVEAEGESETAVPEALEGLEGQEESLEPTIEVHTEDEVEPEPEILPSRTVSLKKGETLVITYPGSGWIYMGSTSEYNNLASRGRKLGTTDTKYTLLAKEAGTQIHHFYKVDNLTGEYIDDYIEVTVLEKKGNSSTVVNAPEYSQVVPKKPETPAKATPKANPVQKQETTEQVSEKVSEQTSITLTDTTTKTSTAAKTQTQQKEEVIEVEPEESVIEIDEEEEEQELDLEPLLDKARTGISSKKYDDAYTALTQYLEFSTDNRDEALYLLGQLLESDSPYKNIKQAVETYQTLCDSYPASKYWDNANKRIVYLKRFYINIH